VRRILERPQRGRLVVAERDGTIVGFAALSFVWPLEHAGRSAWLEELYVTPPHRERGIGTLLLRSACRYAAADGAVAIDLEVEADHARAAHLYAREGFRPLTRARWVSEMPPAQAEEGARPDATRRVSPFEALSGGCICGAVRYRVDAEPSDVAHCHCSMCRRATGAPLVTWATFPAPAFTLCRGTPSELRVTPRARRTFCGTCGTALTFTELARPGWIDVTVGSFDDPARLPPRAHIWVTSRLAWLAIDDDLPRHPENDPQEIGRDE
jgi:hypothetical protein